MCHSYPLTQLPLPALISFVAFRTLLGQKRSGTVRENYQLYLLLDIEPILMKQPIFPYFKHFYLFSR